ncbi:MAG: beta-N-acetylhexosaminidase [Candidatus Pacebacteria bacterium]|nr:beta-N-acetylhexosaminidase [Candidatus Paceibacterota bacterium]MDD3919189.1 beta-N-acetylhexosaminidase [Candidatus Paceibacterota bacterium]
MNKKILLLFIVLFCLTLIAIPFLNKKEKVPTIDEKIGEMLILGFRGLEVDSSSKIIQDINKYNIGGVILFDYDVPTKTSERNIKSPEQTKKLIDNIKTLTNENLFVAVDAEGGYVNRLKTKYGFVNIKSALEMGKEEASNTFNEASILGGELQSLGFNLNFAPVVDVNVNPENPVIGYLERSFSDDPIEVYNHASYFIDAMHAYNITTAIKHFPGHGSSQDDSHLGLTDVTNTYNKETELLPYKKLIADNKLDMIMTAHVMNTNIDNENPATLSPIFLQNILRDELRYNGIIVSDDMQMGAIIDNFGFDEAIIKGINAGCDLLIFSNNNREYDEDIAEKVVSIIKKAITENKISEDQITQSYNRIIELKQKYGIL